MAGSVSALEPLSPPQECGLSRMCVPRADLPPSPPPPPASSLPFKAANCRACGGGEVGWGWGAGGLASKNVCRRFAAFFFFADELEPSETPAKMELKCHNCLRNNASNKVMVIFFFFFLRTQRGKVLFNSGKLQPDNKKKIDVSRYERFNLEVLLHY